MKGKNLFIKNNRHQPQKSLKFCSDINAIRGGALRGCQL